MKQFLVSNKQDFNIWEMQRGISSWCEWMCQQGDAQEAPRALAADWRWRNMVYYRNERCEDTWPMVKKKIHLKSYPNINSKKNKHIYIYTYIFEEILLQYSLTQQNHNYENNQCGLNQCHIATWQNDCMESEWMRGKMFILYNRNVIDNISYGWIRRQQFLCIFCKCGRTLQVKSLKRLKWVVIRKTIQDNERVLCLLGLFNFLNYVHVLPE